MIPGDVRLVDAAEREVGSLLADEMLDILEIDAVDAIRRLDPDRSHGSNLAEEPTLVRQGSEPRAVRTGRACRGKEHLLPCADRGRRILDVLVQHLAARDPPSRRVPGALPRPAPGIRCPYRSSVIVMLEWPM